MQFALPLVCLAEGLNQIHFVFPISRHKQNNNGEHLCSWCCKQSC